ncbi:MAG: Rne/Rng family ribonuclease [Candidatus Sumerlaeaceae bacterium]
MKRVLINVEDRELRIAILENDQLTELYIESLDDKTILNNIYKGRVEGVLPGLSAAFVNLGFERNAFLHFDDVRPDLLLELKAKREGRELREPPVEIPEIPAEPGQETYQPSPEELEVVTQLQAEVPPEPLEPVVAVAPQGQSQRKRRRGRRGGRNRRKNRQSAQVSAQDQLLAQAAETATTSAANGSAPESPEPSRSTDGTQTTSPPLVEASHEISSVSQAVAGHGQHQSSRRRDRQRQKSRQKKEQRSGSARHPLGTVPPPGAIRGTRAATNPYDVFSPFALPKKQKTEKTRRRKTAHPTLDHLIGPTTLPPDVPIEKDSQLDFFGPAEPAAAPTNDEPVEEHPPATPSSSAVEDEFLDEANGNVAEAQLPANRSNKTRGSQRRSLRRKGPAQYAIRRKKSDMAETTEQAERTERTQEAADAASKRKSSRSRSRKTVEPAPQVAAELSEPQSPVQANTPAETSDAKVTPRKTTSRKKKKEGAADVLTASGSPAEPANDANVAVESATEKKPSRRSRKKADPTSPAIEAPPAPELPTVSQESVEPPVEEKPAKKRASRSTRRKKETSAVPALAAEAPPGELHQEASGPAALESRGEELPAPSESAPEKQQDVSTPGTFMGESRPADVETVPVAQECRDAGLEETGGGEPVASAQAPAAVDERDSETAAPASAADEQVLPTAESVAISLPAPSIDSAVPEDVPAALASAPVAQAAPEATLPCSQGRPSWRDRRHLLKVHEVMRKGDEILVQVTKEEIGGKGARISTYISLPGRYLVLLPFGNNEGGVSRRVESYEERRRLKRLQRKLRHDLGIRNMGLIIRTAGMERSEHELRKDAEFLLSEWRRIQERAASSKAPACVYDDSDILYRLCRDVFDESIDEIVVDNPAYYEKIRSILQNMIPELVPRLRLYEEPTNLFVRFSVDEKIRKAGRRKVWLKSGGYIIIDEAEALTAIDVNTGKFVGKDNQEQMILKTNLEAAQVIARELKLRDIGGIIVIDFIDMRDPRNRETLLNEFRALLRKDHAKSSVSEISEFGLVEMTRKRVRQSLRKTLFSECPYCKGSGVVLSEQQIWIHLKNKIVEILEGCYPRPDLSVSLNPTIKDFVEKNYKEVLERVEQNYGVRITLQASEFLHVEHYHIEKKQREGSVLDALISVPSEDKEKTNGS